MDPVKILKRSWHILWSYRALWVFGLILALAAGGASNNNQFQFDQSNRETQQYVPTPQEMRDGFKDFQFEMQKIFEQGIPKEGISGEALTSMAWVVGVFFVVMIILGIVMAVARYVSETAVIRMVDEYEASGNKMSVREGFRIGWSKTSWRLFLINLIVNLPFIAFFIVALFMGGSVFFSVINGNADFAAFSVVSTLVILGVSFFAVLILSIGLYLLRNFFWRISVLEDADVGESLRRGFAFVLENWKSVGLMWLVMIGLGILWTIASAILFIISIPLVLVTAVVAVVVAALPFLLFVGIFSTFLSGWLPWAAAGLFIAPLFFTLAFSPWVLVASWKSVFTSTVWTLTYREINVIPVEPAAELPAES